MAKQVQQTVVINVKAATKQYKKEMTEAAKASRKLKMEERARKRAIKEADARTREAAEGLKRFADAAGGRLGGAAASVEHLIRGFGQLGGVAGGVAIPLAAASVAIAGAVLATTGLSASIAKLVLSSDEWIDELKEMQGETFSFGTETVAAITDANTAFDAFTNQSKALGVELSAGLAPAVDDMFTSFALLVVSTRDMIVTLNSVGEPAREFVGSLRDISDAGSGLATALLVVATGPMELFRQAALGAGDIVEDSTTKFADLSNAANELGVAFDFVGPTLDDMREGQKMAATAAREHTKALSEQGKIGDQLSGMLQPVGDEFDQTDLKVANLIVRLKQLEAQGIDTSREMAIANKVFEETAEARAEKSASRSAAALEQLQAANVESAKNSQTLIGESWDEVDKRTSDSNKLSKEHLADLGMASAQAASTVAQSISSMAMSVIANQIDMINTTTEAGRAEALKLWRLNKGVQLANAIVNTAVSVTNTASTVPWPANVPLAIAAGLQGGTQIALIASTQPEFHVGTRSGNLAPDELQATLTRRESVLTPQGVESVANANAGASQMGGPTMIQIDHRIFDASLRDAPRHGSRFRSATGRTPLGHRRKG